MPDPNLPMTTNWTCPCGKTHSLRQRVCDQCRRPIPPEVRQMIYEEELAYQKQLTGRNISNIFTAAYQALEQRLPPGVLPILLFILLAIGILITVSWYFRFFGNLGDWLRQLCILLF